jgi:hypothetical protein
MRRLATRFGHGHGQYAADAQGEWWFREAAVVQRLESRAATFDVAARKFRLWLQREVFPPMHRKAEND